MHFQVDTCTYTCTNSQHKDFSLYHQSGHVHLLSYLVLTLMCMFTSSDLLSKCNDSYCQTFLCKHTNKDTQRHMKTNTHPTHTHTHYLMNIQHIHRLGLGYRNSTAGVQWGVFIFDRWRHMVDIREDLHSLGIFTRLKVRWWSWISQ